MPLPARVLMCRPSFFGVQYVINPWMEGHVGRARQNVAQEQWDSLHAEVSRRVTVDVMEGAEQLPDMCFAANAGLVLGQRFVPSHFRVVQRQPEVECYDNWFQANGCEPVHLPEDVTFEGEGDALFQERSSAERVLWAGYGVRSSLESHRSLAELLDVEVVSLRLIDERFYHLDTCFAPLRDGRLLYYPAAFDEMSLREIHRRVPMEKRLAVGESDAMAFACNALVLDDAIVVNHASEALQRKLRDWKYEVIISPVGEFLLAGGAVKCLCLLLQQPVPDVSTATPVESSIRSTGIEFSGHLLDSGLINRLYDITTEAGGEARVEDLRLGQRHDQPSRAQLRITAPSSERLDLIINRLMTWGGRPMSDPVDARCVTVQRQGVAPEDFYSTTIYPTDVRVQGRWIRVAHQRMDAVVVLSQGEDDQWQAGCSLIRDLKSGDHVVCGVDGVRIQRPPVQKKEGEFAFMSAGVSSERRVELAVEELAWEMQRIRARRGRIVLVAGPVVIHTGGGSYLSRLIRQGFVQALLTGNALPTHDIELNLFGTSLGVDLARGIGVHGGHQHHIKAINRVRGAGSIRAAVEQGIITGGVMFDCVRNDVEYVLAGSIRDDGPLPDTIMDLIEAQAAYSRVIENADMIIMLCSMLHAIGTGNMTPAGVRLICVDISPAVVTKLADRGSVESTGIVTDVGLFLNLLAHRLCGPKPNE